MRQPKAKVSHQRMRVIDEILCLFEPEDFLRDTKLSGEFLLGYHCRARR